MNTLSGYLQRDDNGGPIQGLTVVLYDIDITEFSDRDSPASESGSLSRGARYINAIFGADDDQEDSQLQHYHPAGDRLGSTLSDESGFFSITYDDTAFTNHDQEQRPDLVLIVLAPDRLNVTVNTEEFDTSEDEVPHFNIYLGTPERQRIMHLSYFAKRNAGREEQTVIRLSPTILRRFRIDTPTSSSRAFVSEASHARRAQESFYSQYADRLGMRSTVAASRALQEHKQQFLLNVSGISANLRSTGLFVNTASDKDRLFTQSRLEGTSRLSDARFTAHMRFGEQDLIALGISGDPNLGIPDLEALSARLASGSLQIPVSRQVFCEHVQARRGGSELVRVTSLLDAKRDEALARQERLAEEPEQESDTTDGDSTTPSDETLSAEEQIKRLVLQEVTAMTSAENPATELSQQDRIQQAFEHMKPPASPADVKAYHDFSHLQIAFPEVWAEAFDHKIRDTIGRLHLEYRHFERDFGVSGLLDLDAINPENLQDVREYTDLLTRLGADVRAIGESSTPPDAVLRFFARAEDPEVFDQRDTEQVRDVWPRLSLAQQQELYDLATTPEPPLDVMQSLGIDPDFKDKVNKLLDADDKDKINAGISLLREVRTSNAPSPAGPTRAESIARANAIVANPAGRLTRVQKLLTELNERLSEAHSFRIFQKNSVNFGILSTLRMETIPDTYQVGDLVASLPLAPGEVRKYTKNEVLKKIAAQKQNERFASSLNDERAITSRAIADIIEKATTSTNFSQTVQTQLSGKVLGFKVGGSTSGQFQRNQAAESQRVKKGFHEAVRKASQEYKNERALEISTEQSSEIRTDNTGEIQNPNNEISVTYLFYELERRYRITQHLHRLTPVILVAQEIPNPADIDEGWLLAHEWILRRSLLDNSFHDALDIVSEGLVQDEVTLEVARQNYTTQHALVEELSETVDSLSTLQETLRNSMVQTAEQEQLARISRKRSRKRRHRRFLRRAFLPAPSPTLQSGLLASGAASLTFGNRGESPAVLEARREALETRLDYLEGALEDSRSQLTRASSALEHAVTELKNATQETFSKRTLVSQLRIHVKDNILHYMHAIWSYEQPDQRFFRLYNLPVDVPVPASTRGSDSMNVTLTPRTDETVAGLYPHWLLGSTEIEIPIGIELPPPSPEFEQRKLHEIADLDNLVGFKGNYMIFPLKACTYITDFMMQDYVDDYFGIRDPEPAADYSTEELLTYAEQIWHEQDTSDDTREALNTLIQQRLRSPGVNDELIVVPTGQLFIEALKGEHALLEHFKEKHRVMDVLKVREEVQAARLENLRMAARLVADEQQLDDPQVDKQIVVRGRDEPDIDV